MVFQSLQIIREDLSSRSENDSFESILVFFEDYKDIAAEDIRYVLDREGSSLDYMIEKAKETEDDTDLRDAYCVVVNNLLQKTRKSRFS